MQTRLLIRDRNPDFRVQYGSDKSYLFHHITPRAPSRPAPSRTDSHICAQRTTSNRPEPSRARSRCSQIFRRCPFGAPRSSSNPGTPVGYLGEEEEKTPAKTRHEIRSVETFRNQTKLHTYALAYSGHLRFIVLWWVCHFSAVQPGLPNTADSVGQQQQEQKSVAKL